VEGREGAAAAIRKILVAHQVVRDYFAVTWLFAVFLGIWGRVGASFFSDKLCLRFRLRSHHLSASLRSGAERR